MGNTPSQRPYEDDAPGGVESTPDESLTARVVRAARSVLADWRRRLTAPLGRDEPVGGEVPAPPADGHDDGQSEAPPPAPRDTTEYRSVEEIPARETPFAYPAGNCEDENGPDLQATEDDGQLAIYYPNCPGATIESDTWERVER